MTRNNQDKKEHSGYEKKVLDSLVKKIEKLGVMKEYRKDEFLFQAEDEASGFFYVLSGAVRVFKMDENGKEVEVARLKPGDFLGEAIVFVSDKFPSFAQALRKSHILFFGKRKILE
ncbi:MAG: Crp/Fnr family transcriptional regulator, partial [Candidatus Aminicenantales bacterium]